MAFAGSALYVFTVDSLRKLILIFALKREISLADLRRLTVPAYLAAGAVMTFAAFFNPISFSLILGSGIASSFGLNAGLLFIPRAVDSPASSQANATNVIAFSPVWLIMAIIVSGMFIFLLGPGIRTA